ncbi:four helix bundle protein [Candidatus Woesearchaeota archaeon]|jgi:four helix bundle protein|nr:four helix bundle protein [Candidatus Woesearchaeota archaeon]
MAREFKKLKVFNESYELVLEIYKLMNKLPSCEERNIIDQARRASTSIVLNIAEGANSNSTKVFFNHLGYSYASAKELEVLVKLCVDLDYASAVEVSYILGKLDTIMGMLYNLKQRVEQEIMFDKKTAIFNVKKKNIMFAN